MKSIGVTLEEKQMKETRSVQVVGMFGMVSLWRIPYMTGDSTEGAKGCWRLACG